MIKGFRDEGTRLVFERQFVKGLPNDAQSMAYRRLVFLDSAERLEDLRIPPGNRLEKLAGDRKGQHSIRINDQWRICFKWQRGDAYDVEITDYH